MHAPLFHDNEQGITLTTFLSCAVVDLVLIMSVNPGFGGQSFIESQVKKIADLRRLCAEKVYSPYLLGSVMTYDCPAI